MAVICIIAKQSQFISYLKAEKARDALHRIGKQMVAARDSEHRTQNEEISRPFLMMGTLIDRLVHDLATPLAVIRGEVEFLPNPCTEEEIRSTFVRINESTRKICNKVEGIVEDQRRWTRDSEKFIQELRTTLRELVDSYPISITLVVPETDMYVRADTSLKDAFRYIIDNVRDAVEEARVAKIEDYQGKLEVSVCTWQKGKCQITIEDNGTGINEEALCERSSPSSRPREARGTDWA